MPLAIGQVNRTGEVPLAIVMARVDRIVDHSLHLIIPF
jgi:hypothetical protein